MQKRFFCRPYPHPLLAKFGATPMSREFPKNIPAKIIPTVGRMVLYAFDENAAAQVNRRREHAAIHRDEHVQNSNGVQIHVGNTVRIGTVYPAVVVAVWGDGPNALVNLKVLLDGTDDFWATSVHVADQPTPGHYHWMDYQKGQAAKTEQLEQKLAGAQGGPATSPQTIAPSEVLSDEAVASFDHDNPKT